MRIRSKVLILLLLSSALPIGATLWGGWQANSDLVEDLATGTRDLLARDAMAMLSQAVRDHGKVLDEQARSLEHHLLFQVRDARWCLLEPPPTEAEVYYVEDFDEDRAPGPLLTNERRGRRTADGRRQAIPFSNEYQSFLIAPGVAREEAIDDVYRLTRMLGTYRLIDSALPSLIQWQYTATVGGVHTAYPGHGQYPAEYDPRGRLWFERAVANAGVTWNLPIVDASTRQVVLTLSAPVYGLDGELLAVTAIDVPVVDLVRQVELPSGWAPQAETMLVFPLVRDDSWRLFILAQSDFDAGSAWDVPVEPRYLDSPDAGPFEQVVDDIANRRAAVRRMAYGDRESFWAYGPLLGTDSSLVVIVPTEAVMAPALAGEQQVRARLRAHRVLIITVFGAVLAAAMLVATIVSRAATRPVRELSEAAHRIADGDLETRVAVRSADEIGELGATFNAMLPKLRDQLKLKQSLALAMEVQQGLLPDAPPQIEGLDVAGHSTYCDETGGDYYDFLDLSEIDERTLGVAIGDVTGHGIAAALLMATARALLRSQAARPGSVSALLNHLNRHLSADVPPDKFITLCYLLLDARTRTVRWASAGHDPPLVFDPQTGEFRELHGCGIPAGVEADWQYEEFGPEQLAVGSVIVVGTDGIWEARNPGNDMFGKQRLRDVVRAAAGSSAADIAHAITEAVGRFRGVRPQDDDLTLVVVKLV
jgi:sigma-B regulation protein RsbU (phosphoserine phosphatase)